MTEMRIWSNDDLRTITDVVPALISFFDANHVCRFANNYHRFWYGRRPEELVGLHMSEFLGRDAYNSRGAYLEKVRRGETVAFDAKVPHLDGTPRDSSIRYIPRIVGDTFDGFYILVFDTAIYQHRFRSVFDGTALAFCELDTASALRVLTEGGTTRAAIKVTRYLDINAKAAAMFGLDRRDAVGISISRQWPASSEASFAAALTALKTGQATFETESNLLRSDGTSFPALLSCTFPAAGGGGQSLALGILDLTDRVARETALAELQNDLAHAARVAMLGELTASIAHEVNQPLGAVVNNGNAALRWLNRPEPELSEVRRSLELVVSEAKRAADVIARTRALAVKGTAERRPAQSAELAGESMALVERQIAALGATLSLAVDTSSAILVDQVQIQQVLVNLLINAAQAMLGRATAEIRLSVFCEGGSAVFQVDDTGPGLPADRTDQLFNAFYTTKATGMGIGLSVSKTIVEAHGGTITAGPAPTGGARFSVTIPVFEGEAC